MSTETILSTVPSSNEADLTRVQWELRDGHLLVVPMDTVHGVDADVANPEAVVAILAAKGYGWQTLSSVPAASIDTIDLLCADIPGTARALVRTLQPGGLTLILRIRPDLGWDLDETGGIIGVRMPNQATLLYLLHDFGPMAVTFTNLTGQPPATSVEQAIGYFETRVSAYLDGGPTQGSTASSIVDLAHETPRVLRLGTISLDGLGAAAGIPTALVEGTAS